VIVLDTHVWIWWVHADPQLPDAVRSALEASEEAGLGVSAISCWEVAKLVEYKRLTLPMPVLEWMQKSLSYPGVRLLDLSPEVAAESTQLPGEFHRDPADQIIVATARLLDAPLATVDAKIAAYPHVKVLSAAT
jgi:PIN domain nuclease of toxin-antitoxin system